MKMFDCIPATLLKHSFTLCLDKHFLNNHTYTQWELFLNMCTYLKISVSNTKDESGI